MKRKALAEPFPGSREIDATTYMYGTRPDTISNFGWIDNFLYMEINNNGRLNMKATLGDLTLDEKRIRVTDWTKDLKDRFAEFRAIMSTREPKAGSHTILSLDLGLKDIASGEFRDGTLGYSGGSEETIRMLRRALSLFYGVGQEASG